VKEQSFKKKKIGVMMGGLSREREISMRTGKAILKALTEKGYHALAIDVGQDIAETLIKEKIEVAFIALHGRFGEDGTIQGMLELMRIPYTGSGVLASALALHKIMAKKFSSASISPPQRMKSFISVTLRRTQRNRFPSLSRLSSNRRGKGLPLGSPSSRERGTDPRS
jgi:D-alanine--D-alanine ligase